MLRPTIESLQKVTQLVIQVLIVSQLSHQINWGIMRIWRLNLKVTITSEEQPKRTILVDSREVFYTEGEANFWMNRPRGDDWLQQVRSNFEFRALSVESHGREMTVKFETELQAQEFEDWLLYANREADEGYRTMRG